MNLGETSIDILKFILVFLCYQWMYYNKFLKNIWPKKVTDYTRSILVNILLYLERQILVNKQKIKKQ
mgnify:CR=1 FL=1